MPVHHPDPERLLEYAAGSASPAMSVLIATHLALCPSCRKSVDRLERMGGAMLESLGEEPGLAAMSHGAFDSLLARLDEGESLQTVPKAPAFDPLPGVELPEPVRKTLKELGTPLQWKSRGKGIEEAAIPFGQDDAEADKMILLRIQPGQAVLEHTHDGGEELTMVLSGGFSDSSGHYVRGDIQTADDQVVHKPIADEGEVCICLAVVEGSLRFTGTVGRVLNFFIRA